MSYKFRQTLYFISVVTLLLLSVYVIFYYLLAKDVTLLRQFPPTFLIVVVFYILIQLLKRFLQDEMAWHNYLYYVGLAAVVAPLPLYWLQEELMFLIARVGSLFLLISPLIELIVLNKEKKKMKQDNSSDVE